MYSRAQANTLQSLQLSHLKQHIQILLVAHSAAIHHHSSSVSPTSSSPSTTKSTSTEFDEQVKKTFAIRRSLS